MFASSLFANTTLIKAATAQQNNETQTTEVAQDITNPIKEDDLSYYDLGIIIKLIQSKDFKNHVTKQIEKVESEIKKITKNINDEVLYPFDNIEYQKELRFLNSKININSKYDNNLAISRDMLKVKILENKKYFADTINSIIDGKNSFKDKKYFIHLLDAQLKRLKRIDLSGFEKHIMKS